MILPNGLLIQLRPHFSRGLQGEEEYDMATAEADPS